MTKFRESESEPPRGAVPRPRWEAGSEFHWIDETRRAQSELSNPWAAGSLTATGRDALRTLLAHGRASLQWQRLWTPSYFCQEVLDAIDVPGLELRAYPDLPGTEFRQPAPSGQGDVLLVSNTFGLRERPGAYDSAWAAVIEDHTHDPWSAWARASRADFCVASLRKTLPVPDGAALWSPVGLALPRIAEPSAARTLAVADKTFAMLLKRLYLSGQDIDKARFRQLAMRGEATLASGEPVAMSTLSEEAIRCMPLADWRAQRRANATLLASRLARFERLTVLPAQSEDCCPFSVLCVTRTASERSSLRDHLLQNSVYPAILWPLSRTAHASEEAVALSERVLSLHCDMRYDADDMNRIADIVQAFLSTGGQASQRGCGGSD